MKRRVVTVEASTSAESRADLGTQPLLVHGLRQLRELSGLALDGTENSANGDGEEGQDENGQHGAALQTISGPGQGNGGVLEALENLVRTK